MNRLAPLMLALLLLAGCGKAKVEHLRTDLDLTQYESMILDIESISDGSFTGQHPWAYPCTYTVNYALGEDFCVGDRVDVYYTTSTESEDAHEGGTWTAEVEAAFVDYSEFQLDPNACYKPVIYLYPTEEMEVSVRLDYAGALTVTEPEYGDGWTVTARPDGTLADKGGNLWPYLFWEGESDTEYDLSKGFCVRGEDTEAFLREKLIYLGLNENETQEFIEFWVPRMDGNPYNLIAFQGEAYTNSARLTVTPEPDSVLRVFMAFRPLGEPVEIEPQALEPFARKGFALIEWGGAVAAE